MFGHAEAEPQIAILTESSQRVAICVVVLGDGKPNRQRLILCQLGQQLGLGQLFRHGNSFGHG